MKTVIASGYFLIYHAGHEEYLRKAKDLAGIDGRLLVILNNDHQQKLKYKKVIVPFEQRKAILKSVRHVDAVVESADMNHTVCYTIRVIVEANESDYNSFIFAKGGDQSVGTIPERQICEKLNVRIVDGLGDKIQSSSTLLKL